MQFFGPKLFWYPQFIYYLCENSIDFLSRIFWAQNVLILWFLKLLTIIIFKEIWSNNSIQLYCYLHYNFENRTLRFFDQCSVRLVCTPASKVLFINNTRQLNMEFITHRKLLVKFITILKLLCEPFCKLNSFF